LSRRSRVKEQRFDDEELVGKENVVFARFHYVLTLPDGSTTTARALACYRLSGGKIVVSDVMFDPDLMKVLGRSWRRRLGHSPRRLTKPLRARRI
jgi:hypothetical protein